MNEPKTKAEIGKRILYFTASWCGPCRQLGPIMGQLADELGDNVAVAKVALERENLVAQNYANGLGVQSIPTLVFLEDGIEKDRITGYRSKTQLKEKITEIYGPVF